MMMNGGSGSGLNPSLSVNPASSLGTGFGFGGLEHHRHYSIDNPMPHRLPEGENAAPLEVIGTTASDKLVIIMVGLPATGTFNTSFTVCGVIPLMR
jgi:hypothetical protein